MRESEFYDRLAESYDLLISWRARLKRERPFFTRVFKEYGVERVLDTACGTGVHAMAFHDWGYYVEGSDVSPKMVAKARENAGNRDIRFAEAGFTDVDKINGMFDAVTCLGNSLPHVLTDEDLAAALSAFYDLLLPGGVLVIHGNNYDGILEKRERFMPLAQVRRGGTEYLFVRFFDFKDDLLDFNVISLVRSEGIWQMHQQSTPHRALTKKLLEKKLLEAGFADLKFYGGYPGESYEKTRSDNLIVVAAKPHTKVSCPPREPVAAIDRIPIRENADPLVDIEAAIPGIAAKTHPTYCRRKVAEMLASVRAALPEGYNLRVNSGLRLLSHQKELYENYLARLAREHPDWPKSRMRREANKFLAPPDAKHPPGHSTGGALDVTILKPDGSDVDMTSTIEPDADRWKVFPTYSKLITPTAAKNRQWLADLMSAAGFSNYPGEWWHWSYGDSAWAVRTGQPHALYAAANPDEQNG